MVIGLLVTGDGIPIAHHVFAGNTADVSTLPGVVADLQDRFGIGAITMVADRGLISAATRWPSTCTCGRMPTSRTTSAG